MNYDYPLNPIYLKEIMGHESFHAAEKYLNPQIRDLKAQHTKYSPVTNLLRYYSF